MAQVNKRTRQQIFNSMQSYLQNLSSNRLTDYNTGSVLNSVLDVVAAELENVYNENYQTYQANYLETATGDDLDNKAADFGLTRSAATYASGHLLFGRTVSSTSPILIPAGTVSTTVTTSTVNAIQYETTEPAILTAGSLTVKVSARAREAGADGNAAAASIVVLPSPPAGIEYVTNASAFSGGSDDETDDELKDRISAYLDQLQRGTKASLEAAAESVTGVDDAYVEENTPSYGYNYVWVADSTGTASEQLLSDVQTVIDSYTPLGVTATAKAPIVHPIDVELWVTLNTGFSFTTVSASIESEVKAWLQTKKIGDDIYRSELIDIIQGVSGVKKIDTSSETLVSSESHSCTTTVVTGEAQTTSSKKKVTTDYNCYSVQGVYLVSDTGKTTNYALSWDRNEITLNSVPIENEIHTSSSKNAVSTSYPVATVTGVYLNTNKTGTNYYLPSGSSSAGGTEVILGTSLPSDSETVYITYTEYDTGTNTNSSVVCDYTYQTVAVNNTIGDVKGVYESSDTSKVTDHYYGGSFSSTTIYLGDAFAVAGQSVIVDYWKEESSTGLRPYDDVSVAASSTPRARNIAIHLIV